MELIEVKICAAISLLLGTMLIGLLPAWFSSYGRNNCPLFTSSLLCFGGGVLLATSLVHMLPEVRANLSDFKQYAEVFFCGGFFVLYLLDEAVHFFFGATHDNHSEVRCMDHRRNYGSTAFEPLIYEQQHPYNPNYKVENEREIGADVRPSSQLCHIGHNEPCSNAPVGCFGLLIAFCVHAVIEGLAVGLEESSTQVLLLFAAIASHKLVVAFCLGVELSNAAGNTALRHFVSIAIFSMGTPSGIGLGMTVSNVPEHIVQVLLPILQCIAGGTLLYISVSEVLPRERARWHQENSRKCAGICQFLSVLVGFTTMTVLSKYMDH